MPKSPSGSTRRRPRPRWQRRPEARPEEILAAALEVFGEQGFARARLEDVARRAGVSKGTLYLYFQSKEELFRAMVRARVVTAVEAAEHLVGTHTGSARDALETLARAMWASLRREDMARITRLVQFELVRFPELARFYFDEVIARSRRLLETVLRRGVESGEFRPLDVRFAGRLLPGLLSHFGQTQCFFRKYDPEPYNDEQIVTGIIEMYLRGILAPATGREGA